MNTKTLQIANILGLILVLILNTLATTLPLAGRTTGEISDMYPNLFVPAGYAFSIWSLIYILLIIFVFQQAKGLFGKNQAAPEFVHHIGWWFFISCLANATWIIAWHNLLVPLSLLLMLGILIPLIIIYNRLNDKPGFPIPPLTKLSFSVYLGWITVATIANVTTLLVDAGWSGLGISEINWTVIMIVAATLITFAVIWTRSDLAYTLVIVWAFVAIALKRQRAAIPEETIIISTIYAAIALMALLMLTRYFWWKKA